ncbi:MAG: D-alanine--D-alanine ligase [Pseudomonadota bacterium]
MTNAYHHIAILMGGLSSEREISFKSGKACAQSLRNQGYAVTEIDANQDLAKHLYESKPDACFNALHGTWGEDGCVQGILEVMQIPYTHSGVLASALAMHKERAKHVLSAADIPVAESKVVAREIAVKGNVLEPPYVVKPVCEGSSVGIFIVKENDSPLLAEIATAGDSHDMLMVERYVPGKELTCAVMKNKTLDVIEIVPNDGLVFYDYEAKYEQGGSKHILPAKLSPNIYQLIQTFALKAHKALGCKGISRSDFRLNKRSDGSLDIACLEVNTQPGMTETSLVPELAAYQGIEFDALVKWILEDASCNR